MDTTTSVNAQQLQIGHQSSQQSKKSSSKQQQRASGAATSQGVIIGLTNNLINGYTSNPQSSNQAASSFLTDVNLQNTKTILSTKQQPFMNGTLTISKNGNKNTQNIQNLQAALNNSLPQNQQMMVQHSPQKKRIQNTSNNATAAVKNNKEEYCKTIEQQQQAAMVASPNSNTLNLENMKKTQSLHYMRGGHSGASSPQQHKVQQQQQQQHLKSRTSVGKYNATSNNNVINNGYALQYNNYNNQAIVLTNNNNNVNGGHVRTKQSQKSGNRMMGQSLVARAQGSSLAGAAQSLNGSALGISNNGSALERSRSKTTTNRKKRNLYTSIGNYYQSQQQQLPSSTHNPGNINSASRVSKRMHQNFLDNLEQTSLLFGSNNLSAAHQKLLLKEELLLTKKRNKSSTKSYNNNRELMERDQNNNSEICYSSHLTKKNPLTNNFFDVSHFSSNHNSIIAATTTTNTANNLKSNNFDNSFQLFYPPSAKPTQNGKNLHQRPQSSHKSAMQQQQQQNIFAVKQQQGNNKKQQQQQQKSQTLRKSMNAAVGATGVIGGSNSVLYSSNNLLNASANYGSLHTNPYDFFSNANLFLNSGKAARRPKGGNSAIDSRCSQNKDHSNVLGFVKSQVASNTAFGNTSHTTICSNRKNAAKHGDIVSGKKHSLQQQLLSQNYLNLQHPSDVLTAGEISSDRQTLKMNDFLKQIEAYSNDKLDKFMPQMQSNNNNNMGQQQVVAGISPMPNNINVANSKAGINNLTQQVKIAEEVKNLIEREMQGLNSGNLQGTANSKQIYQNADESGANESDTDFNNNQDFDQNTEEQNQNNLQPDYEHLLNVLGEGLNQLISTIFPLNGNVAASHPQILIASSFVRIKQGYEEIINSIVENLSQQIEQLQVDNEQINEENLALRERNAQLEDLVSNHEDTNKKVQQFAKKNEQLNQDISKLKEENKNLKKQYKDRDSQLVESRMIIEKLSASQQQLQTQLETNTIKQQSNYSLSQQISQNLQNDSQQQKTSKGMGKLAVPPLDLGKLIMPPQQTQVNHQPLMSNDSLQTLDKAFINANLQDPNSASALNSLSHPQQDLNGSRILAELYNHDHHLHQPSPPFNLNNQSDISYVNSEENLNDQQYPQVPPPNPHHHQVDSSSSSSFDNQNINQHQQQQLNSLSNSIMVVAQDKSPVMKPFIPPLNLNGLNNRTQAARQGQQQQQQNNKQNGKQQQFKLDLSSVNQQQINQNSQIEQDSSADYQMNKTIMMQGQKKVGGGLGLNLANLKQQKGIVDFQDEFMAKYDEYSESWRNAMNREKRF